METWNQLSDEEIKIGFVASCIESAAERLGCQYDEMLKRMERVGLIDNYIYPHYEALHSEDRTNLIDNIIETLYRWENNSSK
ncbi:MAG: DUF3791 domain-containing protein [Muribaculaceae bacterium]|nr:DUF3791 domain-containing protein [Muribaculaceae bacterium]MDE7457479.1 DUF3791 domain-containing protein [Muribaculaceae bacterium]